LSICHRFRWVACQLEELKHCSKSQNMLRQKLDGLPTTLKSTYDQILTRIEEADAVTIVLRGALCLPLFGTLSRTLSCSLSLSHSLPRSRPLWTPSMIITCTLSFHMLFTFYHMRAMFHMLTVISDAMTKVDVFRFFDFTA
jgi:hypothetical protein